MFILKLICRSVFMAMLLQSFVAVVPAFAEGARPIITASLPARSKGFSAALAVAEVNAYRAA
jgi:hypothetical protein